MLFCHLTKRKWLCL